MPWKTMCPNLAGFGEEFYSSGSRAELLRISVCAGSALLSSGLRWSPDELVLLLFSCQVVSLCDLMGCSTPGFPVFHYLLEFAQTHVHWVSDAIQPSHPLLSSSPPALNLSQHQGLLKWYMCTLWNDSPITLSITPTFTIFVCIVRTLKIYSLNNFQVYSTS